MSVDPINSEIIVHRLREVTAAMEYALFHSGYSPILRESLDGSAGFTDASGRAVMGSGGIFYHVLLYPAMVQGILSFYGLDAIRDGDCYIANDPFKVGNSHVPDVVIATPVFVGERIIAFAVSISHKPDVGGLVAGSSSALAREIFHDGLLIPPVRIKTKVGFVDEVEAIIRNNTRTPVELMGDIRAQVGGDAARRGAITNALFRVRWRYRTGDDRLAAGQHRQPPACRSLALA